MSRSNIISDSHRILSIRTKTVPSVGANVLPEQPQACSFRRSILVIDVSPSMCFRDWKPSRLKAAQEAAKTFVKRVASQEPDAKVAIVIYGRKARLVCDFTAATMYDTVARAIDSVRTIGSTNIAAGLEVACDMLEDGHGLGQVVLLTDGCHNTGPDPRPKSDRLKEVALVECVGIGGTPGDVDEELLRYIASPYPDGLKRYRWIGDKERLVQHFHNLAGRIVRE